jgi:hypothetical protein
LQWDLLHVRRQAVVTYDLYITRSAREFEACRCEDSEKVLLAWGGGDGETSHKYQSLKGRFNVMNGRWRYGAEY